jgi:hypothetical protein
MKSASTRPTKLGLNWISNGHEAVDCASLDLGELDLPLTSERVKTYGSQPSCKARAAREGK